jgi:hypothetical protein
LICAPPWRATTLDSFRPRRLTNRTARHAKRQPFGCGHQDAKRQPSGRSTLDGVGQHAGRRQPGPWIALNTHPWPTPTVLRKKFFDSPRPALAARRQLCAHCPHRVVAAFGSSMRSASVGERAATGESCIGGLGGRSRATWRSKSRDLEVEVLRISRTEGCVKHQ